MRRITKVHILIVNYNGSDLMQECVPSIIAASTASNRNVLITVIDNASTDGSILFLQKNFPQVQIHAMKENKVLFSYNETLKKIGEDVVILLNNDIKVDRRFIDPLIDPFEVDDNLFAVGCKCLDFDGNGFQGEKSIGGFRWGMFWTSSRYRGFERHIGQSSWTLQVALGAFSRMKFLELGGYDDLFFPGTWEDTDLSLRCYRRGWHCLYEPQSVIYHKGQATFHRVHGDRGRAIIAHRNSFLFVWKNFWGTRFILFHIFFVPLRLLVACLKWDWEFISGFFQALRLSGKACSRAKSRQEQHRRTDSQILRLFKSVKWIGENST